MAHRLLLALLVTWLSSSAGPDPTPSELRPIPANAPSWEGVRLLGADESATAATQFVLNLFAEAGLDLPTLTLEFHNDPEACRGYEGLISYGDPVPRVSICSDRPYVLPHELAHAWVYANITKADKAAYVGRWELASWNDPAHDWNDRGTEHAAFTIQQNLTAVPHSITQTWTERAEAYEQLTNRRSPIFTIRHNGGHDRGSRV